MANYGSDDENSSNSSNSSSDENSDVEIENRMKKKKKSFERLEADILENCENLAKDHENREEKWKSGIPTQGKVLKFICHTVSSQDFCSLSIYVISFSNFQHCITFFREIAMFSSKKFHLTKKNTLFSTFFSTFYF